MLSGKVINGTIRQVLFVVVVIGLMVVIATQLTYFFSSLLGAATLYMLLRVPHRSLQAAGWSKSWATAFLIVMSIILVFVVGGAIFGLLYSKVATIRMQDVVDAVNSFHDIVIQRTGYNIFSKDMVDQAIRSVGTFLPEIFSTAGSVVTNGLMMVFVLYFMLQGSRKMEKSMEEHLPLSRKSIRMLEKEARNVVVSNAIGVPLISVGQGLVAGIGYWVLGAGDPVVWGFVTGIFGLVPVVGTAAVWAPMAVVLIINGSVWQGVALLVYGSVVVAGIDNVIRMVFLKKYANVHPLVSIFGIIVGVNLIGFWGIIFGPLIISGLMLLLKIYRNEFLSEPRAGKAGAEDSGGQ